MTDIFVDIEAGNEKELAIVEEILRGWGYKSRNIWNSAARHFKTFDRVIVNHDKTYTIYAHKGMNLPYGGKGYTYKEFIEEYVLMNELKPIEDGLNSTGKFGKKECEEIAKKLMIYLVDHNMRLIRTIEYERKEPLDPLTAIFQHRDNESGKDWPTD